MQFTIRILLIILSFSKASSQNDLKPLQMPPDYENKMNNILPGLVTQLGISSSFLFKEDGYLVPTLSSFHEKLGYLNFWDSESFPDACKSKIIHGIPKVTKYGKLICKRKCEEENLNHLDALRNALETAFEVEKNEAEVVQDTSKKTYECVPKNDVFECVCSSNEVIKVSPDLQDLVNQFFQNDRTRDVVETVSLKKIIALILLYISQKMAKLATKPIVWPLKRLYHAIRTFV